MTLAAVSITPDQANEILSDFRLATGLSRFAVNRDQGASVTVPRGLSLLDEGDSRQATVPEIDPDLPQYTLISELKGSRIDLDQRRLFFNLFRKTGGRAVVGIAISALKPRTGEDYGDRDKMVYAALLNDCIGAALDQVGGCVTVIIDDGRYDALALDHIRNDIAAMIGPCAEAKLELSHRSAGLQIADVIANTFFNRALVSSRQAHMAELVAPFLDQGTINMRILADSGCA